MSAAVLRDMIRDAQFISLYEADTKEKSEDGVYFNLVLVQ